MGFGWNQDAVVTSRSNARVKQLRAAFAGQARLSGGLVAVEGDNLLGEALRSGMVLKTVFVSEGRTLPRMVPRGVEVMWLAEEVFASVMETRSPQGVAALLVPPVRGLEDVVSLPDGGKAVSLALDTPPCRDEAAPRMGHPDSTMGHTDSGQPLILVAAGLQDPGNLGTLVRSAEAFGASGVLTTAGTVSGWNQKALRASAGSIFRVPVVGVGLEELAALKAGGVRLMAAVAEDYRGTVAAQEADFSGACAVMIGNEGAGLSEELLELADVRVTIPCPGRVESLNAAIAGSLLLYEASRQRANAADGGGAMSLFDAAPMLSGIKSGITAPLAERMRPRNLEEYVGQQHLLAPGKPLRLAIERDDAASMIFWGPPGTGKTTLAKIIAHMTQASFIEFSAVLSGIKEIKQVMVEAEKAADFGSRTILFVDEIHRFNKAQQDAFLPYVERGTIRLIGATTENPSFEINAALLSRCRVYTLQGLTEAQVIALLERALVESERGLGGLGIAADARRFGDDCGLCERRCTERSECAGDCREAGGGAWGEDAHQGAGCGGDAAADAAL